MRVFTILFVAALSLFPAQAAGMGNIEMNRPFPDILLPDLETGQPSSIARFKGERVVLQVFASW